MGIFSSLLGGIGSIGSAITGIGGIADGISSLFGGDTSSTKQAKSLANQQFKMQQQLNQQQNEFAKQNALLDYQRQRELTRDQASLQQEGKIAAGVNPATGDGTTASAASVNSTAAPSAGSAPSIDVAALENAASSRTSMFNALLDSSSKRAQMDEDTRGKRLDNDLKQLSFDDQLDKLHNDKVISDEEYEKRKRENRIGNATEQDNIKQTQEATKQAETETRIKALQEENQKIQNDIANIVKQCNEEQRKQLVFITQHQGERFAKEMAEIASRIKVNDASAAASYASAAASRANALYTEVLTKLERAKVPYASQIAAATRDAAVNSAKLTYEQARNQKMATNTAINERGYDENGKVTDSTKFITKWFGDNIRNLVGGVFSASKAIK
nr:MAG TPA: hypothetical protein [Microviridae sp.]